MTKLILATLAITGFIHLANSQTINAAAGAQESVSRRPDFVSIHGDDDKWWEISELNELASNYLWTNGMPKASNYHTRVIISPRDTNIMCRFYYMQGFYRPFWVADIGYDGKVKKFEKRIAKEGGLGQPFGGTPDGKPPKGARLVPPPEADKK